MRIKYVCLHIIIGILVTFIMVGNVPEVQACSCAEPWPVEKALEKRDAVFSGTILKIEEPDQTLIQSSAAPVEVTIKVDKVWKGDLKEVVIIKTALSEASCGYPFVENQDYLIYASGVGEELRTGLCERTTLLDQAKEDLKILGPGKTPAPSQNSIQTEPVQTKNSTQLTESQPVSSTLPTEKPASENNTLWATAAGGILILISAAVYLIVKKFI
jgi:hypothetical protein